MRNKLMPAVAPLSVDGAIVDPVTSVHNLGTWNLYRLRAEYELTYSVTTFQTLVVALVLPRMDYGNGVLLAYLLRRLQ